jgi:hypothetical protein
MRPALEQYYAFQHGGLTWCEMFWTADDGTAQHVTAPTPYDAANIDGAVRRLEQLHPTAVVDTLCDAADMIDAMRFAS